MTTFKERYDKVFGSGVAGWLNQVKCLAQLIYANDRSRDKEGCVVQAMEEHEAMTGCYHDPSRAEYEDMIASII